MKRLDKIAKNPKLLIIDGNHLTNTKIPHLLSLYGDSKYLSIAATTSILAKTNRDEYMKKMDNEHPDYRWKNKGYPTKEHRIAIQRKRNYSTS